MEGAKFVVIWLSCDLDSTCIMSSPERFKFIHFQWYMIIYLNRVLTSLFCACIIVGGFFFSCGMSVQIRTSALSGAKHLIIYPSFSFWHMGFLAGC